MLLYASGRSLNFADESFKLSTSPFVSVWGDFAEQELLRALAGMILADRGLVRPETGVRSRVSQ